MDEGMRPREENLPKVTYLVSSYATLLAKKNAWSSLLSLFAVCLGSLSHWELGFAFPSLESELACDLFWPRECGGRVGQSRGCLGDNQNSVFIFRESCGQRGGSGTHQYVYHLLESCCILKFSVAHNRIHFNLRRKALKNFFGDIFDSLQNLQEVLKTRFGGYLAGNNRSQEKPVKTVSGNHPAAASPRAAPVTWGLDRTFPRAILKNQVLLPQVAEGATLLPHGGYLLEEEPRLPGNPSHRGLWEM